MLDDHESPPENPIYEPDEPTVAGLPSLLRNWQVIEIEGEATPVVEHPARQDASPDQAIPDHPDDVIVATLDQRCITVAAGEAAAWELSVCNKGDRTAIFQIFVDGWIDERWITTPGPDGQPLPGNLPFHALLHPGERATRTIIITPPKATKVAAGDYPLAIVVRASEYPQRFSRLSAQLVIQPYVDFSVGQVRPQAVAFSWFKRTAHITVPVTNRSNCATTFRLQGADARRQLQIEFRLPGVTHEPPKPTKPARMPATGRARPTVRNYAKRHTPSPAPTLPPTLTLQPGQTAQLPVSITARSLPFFGLQASASAVRLAIIPLDEQGTPRAVTVAVACKPLIRPWHVGALLSFFVLALIGAGVMLLMGFLVLRANQGAASPPLANQVAAPPVITILVNLPANQPDALTNAPVAPPVVNAPDVSTSNSNQPDPTVPLVLPDQISGPGDAAPGARVATIAQPAPTVSNVQPAATEQHLTYQQMFRAIGRRYDLSWRMLAAQAYIESSFDSVALGDAGAMGLMQIMPNTWREWAPVVEVSDPFDSYSNALVAAVYLDYLRTMLGKQGHPEAEWMLVAYNWGIDKVLRHLEAGQGWDELPAQSRQYALDILQIAATLPAN